MSRPLRLEYPGALFHVMSRGNEKRAIVRDDRDRQTFVDLLGEAVEKFGWILYQYALLDNHYHLFLKLTQETLSRGVKWLNGSYVQRFNARYERIGHLFHRPFKSLLVERETYFLTLLRYIALNPVRAGIVERPEDYEWSSHRAILGEVRAPAWLAVDDALMEFAPNRNGARILYRQFVNEGRGMPSPFENVVAGVFLGSDAWVESLREKVDLRPRSSEHPMEQRRVGRASMSEVVAAVAEAMHSDADAVRKFRVGPGRMIAAWVGVHEALLSNAEIAAGLRFQSSGHVTRLVKKCEKELATNKCVARCIDESIATLRRTKALGKMSPLFPPGRLLPA